MANYGCRPMENNESLYTYRQSTQISNCCGLIGWLKANVPSNHDNFFKTWHSYRDDLVTEEFDSELTDVIASLREDRHMLYNYELMLSICAAAPESRLCDYGDEYGFRIDTDQYTYMLRLHLGHDDSCDVFCYCYIRKWLTYFMDKASHGIRFITPDYEEKFRISDGDKVLVTSKSGESHAYVARYVDDCHVEIGDNLYHICEFAERMEYRGATVIPLRSSLPDRCYVYVPTENKVGIVYKGESGYYQCGYTVADAEQGERLRDKLNQSICVTKAQAQAMMAGSMFGWAVPAADPAHYDAHGNPKPMRTSA